MATEINSVTLFNLSDQLARGNLQFGVLLGGVDGHTIKIHTSFEIIVDHDNSTIDISHLKKRTMQFQVIFPQYHVVGVYQLNHVELSSLSISILSQVQSLYEGVNLFLVYDSGECTKVFDMSEGGVQVPLKINPYDDVEKISATTITTGLHTGKDEDDNEDDQTAVASNIDKKYGLLSTSIGELEVKVTQILHYLSENEHNSSLTEADIKIHSLITHMANKIEKVLDSKTAELGQSKELNLDLESLILTSKLSLLNSQVTTLRNLKAVMTPLIVRNSIAAKGYSSKGKLGAYEKFILENSQNLEV